MRIKPVVALATVMVLSTIAHAEINVAASVEALVQSADYVIRGKITDVKDSKGENDVIYRDITVKITELIAGSTLADPASITFRYRIVGPSPFLEKPDEADRLFFLSRPDPSDKESSGLATPYARYPSSLDHGFTIDLANPKGVFTANMKELRDPGQIMDLVRAWAKKENPDALMERITGTHISHPHLAHEVPFDSEIFKQLFSGSTVEMVTPITDADRPKLEEEVKNGWKQGVGSAAAPLVLFPDQQSAALLAELLKSTPGEGLPLSQSAQCLEIAKKVQAYIDEQMKQGKTR